MALLYQPLRIGNARQARFGRVAGFHLGKERLERGTGSVRLLRGNVVIGKAQLGVGSSGEVGNRFQVRLGTPWLVRCHIERRHRAVRLYVCLIQSKCSLQRLLGGLHLTPRRMKIGKGEVDFNRSRGDWSSLIERRDRFGLPVLGYPDARETDVRVAAARGELESFRYPSNRAVEIAKTDKRAAQGEQGVHISRVFGDDSLDARLRVDVTAPQAAGRWSL